MDDKTIAALLGSGGAVSLLIKYLVNRKAKRSIKNKILSITNHNIFYYFDEIERQVKTEFSVPESIEDHLVKQEAFKDIMINKIRIWRKILKGGVKEYMCMGTCNKCEMKISKSIAFHMELLSKGIDLYNNYYRTTKYTKNDQDVLDICMEKFNGIHNPKAAMVSNSIECNHTVPDFINSFCPITATGLILDIYRYAFSTMIADISESIYKTNGSLKGRSFKRKNYSIGE